MWRVSHFSADHPRIRGEHSPVDPSYSKHEGSSPHTRGARYREIGFETIDRIIPAYAGSTTCTATSAPPQEDHPRIRGEHLPQTSCMAERQGSSPHTRGAPPRWRPKRTQLRIIPAYAGSTPYHIIEVPAE